MPKLQQGEKQDRTSRRKQKGRGSVAERAPKVVTAPTVQLWSRVDAKLDGQGWRVAASVHLRLTRVLA